MLATTLQYYFVAMYISTLMVCTWKCITGQYLIVCFVLLRARYTTIKGTKYAVGYMVCSFINDDEVPTFGRIEDIVSIGSGSIFIISLYKILTFNTHFHAYEVTLIHNELLVMQQEELADYLPLEIYKSFSLSSPMYIRTKYHLM